MRGHRTATPGKTVDACGHGHVGYSYLHNAVDDDFRPGVRRESRNEKKETAVAFWRRAWLFFAGHGITVQRVMTDNGACYRSRL